MRFAAIRLSGGKICGTLRDWLGLVRIFGNILLKATICKIYATVFHILDIGNLAVISGSVKGGYTDS